MSQLRMRLLARKGSLWPIVFAAGQQSGAEPAPEFTARLAPIPACEALVAAGWQREFPDSTNSQCAVYGRQAV